VVEGGLGEVGDGDKERLAVAGLGLSGVEGKQYGLEAGEGGGVRGVDAGEVKGGDERQE
jgi:hypothetical protein